METLIIIIWSLIPAFFFLTALWHTLKKDAFKSQIKKNDIIDLWKQGFFVSICVLITYLIYKKIYILYFADFIRPYAPDFVAQFLLLPIIFVIAAKIFGPSTEIRIAKLPELQKKKKK